MFNWIANLIKRNTTLILKSEWEVKPKRARVKGKYKADDKSTKNYNEAWVGGKAPKKKKKKKTKKRKKQENKHDAETHGNKQSLRFRRH